MAHEPFEDVLPIENKIIHCYVSLPVGYHCYWEGGFASKNADVLDLLPRMQSWQIKFFLVYIGIPGR